MKVYCLLVFVLGVLSSVESQTPLNAALRKPVDANYTCGSPAEEYYTTLEKDKLPDKRIVQICDASDPNKARPPSNLVDGSLVTVWQSTAPKTVPEYKKAYIHIDLQQKFFAREIKLTMGLQYRPKAIKITKSTTFGASFDPYHYIVTSPESVNCQMYFRVQAYSKGVALRRVNQVLCRHYEDAVAKKYNETISVDLVRRSEGVDNAEYTPEVLDWLAVTNIKITFEEMGGSLDKMADRFNHYTVREIEFFARCDCQGHGDGNNCPQDETTKRRSCVCQNNTCGENCERCCPLYNQKPWAAGSKAPWDVDTRFTCEPCNCHNHSDLCVYNQTVNDLKLSLDIHGNRSGGGVCQGCKNHTRGINCEKCEEFYYRPKGRDHKRDDACKACMCNAHGTKNVSTLAFMDCVSDDTELSQHSGKEPGDCYCKSNVQGSKCDRCKPEFYNLKQENPEGCTGCDCHRPGTVNGSNICNMNSTGQCYCKKQVELRDCSQCKYGYYNLKNESAEGCESCGCDVGGTYPQNKCHKVTGQCRCRKNVARRTCNKPANGSYSPDLHFISACNDPYKSATNNLSVLLTIPQSTRYRIIIKTTSGDSLLFEDIESFEANSTALQSSFRTCVDNDCNVPAGDYFINITANQGKKLGCVTALPKEFLEATVLGDRKNIYHFKCGIEQNDMRNERLCYEGAFSIVTAFLNGSLECACNKLGSYNHTTCEEFAGQCSCKPGVEGRDCGRCRPGYYNLTIEGCTLCACKGPNNVCHPETGMCECPANTIGRTCDPCQCNNNSNKCLRNGQCLDCQYSTNGPRCEQCVNMTYGDALRQQCQACDCNSTGSLGSYCDIITGQCSCKPKITGRACDVCQNNTYDFGSSGCTDCGCNVFGSLRQHCNVSGHCQCKTGAEGMKCSTCTTGYYGLSTRTCRACNCNATGTLNDTVCDNDSYGQCKCKPGVTGRACDRCDKYYRNFTDQGCTTCPECVMWLTKRFEAVKEQANMTSDKGDLLKSLSNLNTHLSEVELLEGRTAVNAREFIVRLSTATDTHDKLSEVELLAANASYNNVYNLNDNLMKTASNVLANVLSELNRTKEIQNETKLTEAIIRELHYDVQAVVDQSLTQSQFSATSLRWASEIVTHMQRNFSDFQSIVDVNTKIADNLTAFVGLYARKVFNQTLFAKESNREVENKRRNLRRMMTAWNLSESKFFTAINSIRARVDDINLVLISTQILGRSEFHVLNESEKVGNDSMNILNLTKSNLQSALTTSETYKLMITEISGEIQFSMLRYEHEGEMFSMKILAGRNLSARDFPSGTADPYLVVSLIPDVNDNGEKTSDVKIGTLNPTWTTHEEIFKFKIKHDQLKTTKLNVRVMDYDPDDSDDFMGSLMIDLSGVGDEQSTNWYRLKSEDVSQIEDGYFNSTSGLVDASNLLQGQIGKLKGILDALYKSLIAAQEKTELMKKEAEAMQKEWTANKSYGGSAVEVLDRYTLIESRINNSMNAVSRASNTMYEITVMLNVVTPSMWINMASEEQTHAASLYNESLKRNLSEKGVAHLDSVLTRLNESLKDVFTQLHHQAYDYPDLTKAAARLKHASKDATPAFDVILKAQGKTRTQEALVKNVMNEVNDIDQKVVSLQKKIHFIKNSDSRDSEIIEKALVHVNNASQKMNNSRKSVEEATKIDQEVTDHRQNISNTLSNVERKLNVLKTRLRLLNLGMRIVGKSKTTYSRPAVLVGQLQYTGISMIVKSNSSRGRMLSMPGKVTNSRRSARSVDNQIVTGIYISLENGFVKVVYNVGKGDITLINPLRMNDGSWTRIDYSRKGTTAALTVESPTQSRTVKHDSGVDNATINFEPGDSIVLGQDSLDSYEVVFSTLEIDQYQIYLWQYRLISGAVKLELPVYPNRYFPENGMAATFYSAHTWSQEITQMHMSSYFEIQFYFRTFEKDGVLMTTFNDNVTEFLLYLKDGRLYAEMRNGSTLDVIQSKISSYNSGDWVKVLFVSDGNKFTLNTTHDGSIDSNSKSSSISRHRLQGTHISIGSLSTNISTSGLQQSKPFIGDVRDVKLSTDGAKSFQDVSLKQSVHHKGVYAHDVITGKVEPAAARFYGFTKETKICSYVSINNTKSTTTSLSFMFKTLKKNELLLYSKTMSGDKTVFLYVALWHGNLQILNYESTSGEEEESKPYMTAGISFADNIWREVYINSSAQGYSVYVNSNHIYTGWFGNGRQYRFNLSNPLYLGGVPPNMTIPLKVAVTTCFEGAMKNVKIHDMEIDIFSQEKANVIKGGVLLARTPPPPPPTCGAPAGPIAYSADKTVVGFASGFTGMTSQSYIRVDNGILFADHFSWSLEVRPLSSNGLVFYIADNLTHPGQFMSLELIDGKIKLQIHLNPGLMKYYTKMDYVNVQRSNSFTQISGIYFSSDNFIAFLLPQTQEYDSYIIKETTRKLNLTGPLFIGGAPNNVKLHALVTQRSGFSGCMKSFSYGTGNVEKIIDISKPTVSQNTQSCIASSMSGFGLNGTSWIKFGNLTLNTTRLDIQLDFRTSSRQGIILYLANNENQRYLKLEQVNGQLELTYKNASNFARKVTWTASSSYFLCNMTWHMVKLKESDSRLQLTVDQSSSVFLHVPMETSSDNWDLFIGGMTASSPSPLTGFVGCIRNFRLTNRILDYGRATDGKQVTNGCAKTGNRVQ